MFSQSFASKFYARLSPLSSSCCKSRNIVRNFLPDIEYPNICIPQFLLEQCDAHSDKTALIESETGKSYRYSELKQAVRSISSSLIKSGSLSLPTDKQAGNSNDIRSTVSVISANRPEFVFASNAALMCGARVAMHNHNSTENELLPLLKLVETELIFTDAENLRKCEKLAAQLDSIKKIVVLNPGSKPEKHTSKNVINLDEWLNDDGSICPDGINFLNAEDTAMFMFSSGTTGMPKAVMTTHRNILSNIVMTQSLIKTPIGCIKLNLLPLFHVYSQSLIQYGAMLKGGISVTMRSFKPNEFLQAVQNYKIEELYLIPPLIHYLINNEEKLLEYDLSKVELITSGAAKLSEDSSKRIFDIFYKTNKKINVLQGYGLTETSPTCLAMPTNEFLKPHERNRHGSVGMSLPNQQCKVIDPDTGHELGPNQSGELCFKGPHVMKGYYKNPEATEAVLDKSGWFRSGDIGYYDDEHWFYITDRIKDIWKTNGMQVSPTEIESLLRTHDLIEDCAVIGVPHERLGETAKAFVVRKSEDLTKQEVYDLVANNLRKEKRLEGGVEWRESIPKNPSGKILRKELK